MDARHSWVPLAVVFLVGPYFGACTQNDDPDTAAYWIERLDNRRRRSEALKMLGKIGDDAALPHVKKWFNERGNWQPDAAYTLGQLGDKSVVPDLIDGIDFQVGTGRDRLSRIKNRTNSNIARALAMLEAKAGVEPLLKLLDSPEARVRETVINALADLGDPRATQPLVDAALEDEEPFIRKTAVQALGNLGDPDAIGPLIKMLYLEAPGISFFNEARRSLVQIGKPAVGMLMKTMQRKNEAVESIRMQDGSEILDGAVEAKAASVLGAMEAQSAESLMLQQLKKFYRQFERSSGGRMSASIPGAVIELSYALGNLGSDKAVPTLIEIAKNKDPNLRLAATEALTAIGAREAVAPLLKAARAGKPKSKQAALVAATRLGNGSHRKRFDAVANADPDLKGVGPKARVRLEAAQECKRDVGCWRQKLDSDNGRVREKAAYELGWMQAEEALPDLMEAAEDEGVKVRMAAVLALGQLPNADPEALLELYEKYADELDYRSVNRELLRIATNLRNARETSAPSEKTSTGGADGQAKAAAKQGDTK